MSVMSAPVKVDPGLLSDADYETGCSVLASSVRCLFNQPGINDDYQEWLKTEEGQMADMTAKQRKEQRNETRKNIARTRR